jgi:diaminopimelate decarboxylase
VSRDPAAFGDYGEELGRVVSQLAQATGFKPAVLDIGGGWAREREPEARSLAINPHPIEAYADAVTLRLMAPLAEAGIAPPALWLEPGRFIVGNAVLLAGRVGRIKRDGGAIWVNADFSTNNVTRIDSSASAHHVLAACGMHRPFAERGSLVGPTCTVSLLAGDWPVPQDLRSGEPIALLDAGMYAETTSNQLNGIPRPATVLVGDGAADVIKERETVEDVFAKSRIPARLAP